MEKPKKIGVVGAGMMGAEIALCFATAGCEVVLLDRSLEFASKGKQRLPKVLDRSIEKGKTAPDDKDPILSRITPADDEGCMESMDLVIEAVFEDLKTKKDLFSRLDHICRPDCLFATNTSSISITLLATSVSPARTARFVGAHFFSPASIMKLVEVIPGLETAPETVSDMMAICRMIGKTPIQVKDVTGFAVNRILHAMLIEVTRLVEEQVVSPEDADTACRLGLGHPVGPLALMDLGSNQLCLQVQQILYDTYGERFRPRPILKQKVDAGHLGRKTGRGWFEYGG